MTAQKPTADIEGGGIDGTILARWPFSLCERQAKGVAQKDSDAEPRIVSGGAAVMWIACEAGCWPDLVLQLET
jgi:hypothetical protein